MRALKLGLHHLVAKPGFSLVAILTLALGISASTTIFTLIDGMLLRPLPYESPQRLVAFWGAGSWSKGELQFLRDSTRSYDEISAYDWTDLTLTGLEQPLAVASVESSTNLFALLGAKAAHGRVFRMEEDQPGSPNVVVLSDNFWRRAFAADPEVVGQSITLNGQQAEVIGIMAPSFNFPTQEADLWLPLVMDPAAGSHRGNHYLRVIGRMTPEATLASAQAELEVFVPKLQQEFELLEDFDKLAVPAQVTPLHENMVGHTRPALLLLLAAVGFMLLIACANVANLLLVHAAGRRREIAIRSALGATRTAVIRQLLAESTVLALVGGGLGLLLASWGVDLVVSSLPAGSPRLDEIAVDPRALVFCIALSLATVFIFGLAPALQTANVDLRQSLTAGGRSGDDSERRLVRKALVVAEVALASVLVIGAGLLGKSFYRLMTVDPGFTSSSALTFRTEIASAKYSERAQKTAFFDELMSGIEALPGVEAAGANWMLPIAQKGSYQRFTIEGRPDPRGAPEELYWRAVFGDYLGAMGMPLIAGRDLSSRDLSSSEQVCLINETMAKRYWPGESPLGARIQNSMDDEKWVTVVGVVGDVKHNGLEEATELMMYRPYAQSPPWVTNLSVVVRSAVEPAGLIRSVREVARAIDRDVPLFEVRTLDEIVANSVSQERLTLALVALFGAASLALAAIGVFGVLSFTVSQRVHEIGVRRALGARREDVIRMVVKEGMILALAGLSLGLLAAMVLTRWISGLLFGVAANDPLTYLVVAAVIALAALAACYLPGRRASRVDPIVVLRHG